MGEPRNTIRIVNVVVSSSIGREVSLKQLAVTLDGAEYNPQRFPGLVYRTTNPKAAALLFRSGKLVCTGGKSFDEARKGVENAVQALKNVGVDVSGTPEITVQNVVATADLHSFLNLNAIAVGLGLENVEYEPEQFPGLVYRLAKPKMVILLFSSGKLVITGGRKLEDVASAVDQFVKELKGLSLMTT